MKRIEINIDADKTERVEEARKKLMELFDGADENQLNFIEEHVRQLAWLGVSIRDLQAEIDETGPVIPFQNGKDQSGLQAHPGCKLLKDYQTLYNTQFKALLRVLPEKPMTSKLSAFLCNDLDLENV